MPTHVTMMTFIIVIAASASIGQPSLPTKPTTRTRTELLNELSLRTAQVALERSREEHQRCQSDYEDAQRLFDQSIISKKELDEALSRYTQARQQLDQAEIALEKTRLGFLDNATHITIIEAKKYYNQDGRRMLDVMLMNASDLTQAESAVTAIDPNTQQSIQWQNIESIRALLDIENIIVSIVSNGASIGKPYEAIIPLLPYQKQHKVTFELLTDVEQAGVKLQYLAQTVTDVVYLEKESSQTRPTVVAPQFALEGQLGSEVSYELNLEMLVTSPQTFSMALTNMPPQINCFFVEGASRITSVRFSEEVSKHNLTLRASVPRVSMRI